MIQIMSGLYERGTTAGRGVPDPSRRHIADEMAAAVSFAIKANIAVGLVLAGLTAALATTFSHGFVPGIIALGLVAVAAAIAWLVVHRRPGSPSQARAPRRPTPEHAAVSARPKSRKRGLAGLGMPYL